MAKYTFQAPKDYDSQSAKYKKRHSGPASALASGDHIVQIKYDGVFSATNTTDAAAITRQQMPQPAAGPISRTLRTIFGGNHLVFKELWIPGTLHKAINGASRRLEEQPQLHARVFDIITVDEFNAGKCAIPYIERLAHIKRMLELAQDPLIDVVGEYKVRAGITDEELTAHAISMQQDPHDAYDGLIVRDLNAIWVPGASKDGAVMKIKPPDTLDLEVVAQHAEQRDTKLGGYVTVLYKGVATNVGGGLTQEDLHGIMLWNSGQHSHPDAKNFVGQIAEIAYLEVTPDGKLREPRIKRWRHDALREEDKN